MLALKLAALFCLYLGWKLLPPAPYSADLWMTRKGASFIDNLANFDGAWFVRVAMLGYQRLAAGDYDLAEETKRLRVMDRLGYEQALWPPRPGDNRFDRGYGFRHWPVLPLIIRALARVGVDPVHAGLLVTNFCSLAYGVLLFFLLRKDYEKKTALAGVALSQLHPGAYSLTGLFTEPLFLFLAAGSMFAARERKWIPAGALAGVAAATRIDGCVLAVPLAWEWLAQKAEQREASSSPRAVLSPRNLGRAFRGFAEWPGVWWLLLIPAGTASVLIYFARVSGDPFIWAKVHEVNRYGHVNFPWLMLIETYRKGAHVWLKELPLHGLLFIFLFLAAGKIRDSYWVWMLVFFLYHASNANHSYLRYQVNCLPLFAGMAAVCGEREWLEPALLALFGSLFGLYCAMFINGYWTA